MTDIPDGVVYRRGDDVESDTWDDTILIKAYDNAVSALKAKFAERHPEQMKAQNTIHKKKKNKQKQKGKRKIVQSHQNPKTETGWNVDDICRAVYTEDGEIYEAKIIDINEDGTCTVFYTEYGNVEEKSLDELLPAFSNASSTDNKTDTASETENERVKMKSKQESKSKKHKPKTNSSGGKPRLDPPRWPWNTLPNGVPPPPPPPPHHNPTGHPFSPYTAPTGWPSHQPFGMPPMFPPVPPPPPMFNFNGSESDNEALYTMLISWYMSGYHTGFYQGRKECSKSSVGGSLYSPHR